jgi:hypothetical protein
MKLSIDSLRQCAGFDVLWHAFSTYVRRGPSCSQRRDSQACCGRTGPWHKATPLERGLNDGLPPPLGERVERSHACQQAQVSLVLHPPRRPHLRAERLMDHHEAQATIQLTYGRVGWCGRESGSRERTLPGLHQALAWPAQRRPGDDRCRRPERVRPMGHHEVPGPPCQVRWGRRRAGFRGRLPGSAAACLDEGLRPPPGHETRGHARVCPAGESVLEAGDRGLDGGEEPGPLHRTHTTGNRGIAVGLLLESTATRRSSRRQAGQGVARHRAPITDAPPPCGREGDSLLARARSWKVPWGQRQMTPHPALIVPPGLDRGAGLCRTPASTGKRRVARFRQCTAGAVSAIDVGTGGQPASRTHRFAGLDLCPGRTEHVLQTGAGLRVPTWLPGFGRDVHRRAHGGDLCRPWHHRRLGLTPHPKGHQSQPALARTRRRAVDTAGATGGGVDVVGSQDVGEQGDRTAWTSRPSSLLGRVLGRLRSPSVTPRGDFDLA